MTKKEATPNDVLQRIFIGSGEDGNPNWDSPTTGSAQVLISLDDVSKPEKHPMLMEKAGPPPMLSEKRKWAASSPVTMTYAVGHNLCG